MEMNSGNIFNGHPQLGQNFSQNGANIPYDANSFNLNDPSANFSFPPQLYNAQLQHTVSEASTRHQSPIPQNFPYQTNSVVPAKRPHGLDDLPTSSPRPGQGPMTNARSQTPQSVHGAQYGGQPGLGAFNSASPFPQMQLQPTPSQGSPPPNMQPQSQRPFQPLPQHQHQQQHRASPQHQLGGLGMPNNQIQMGNGLSRPQQQQMPQNLNQFQGMQNNPGQGQSVAFNAAAAIQGGAQNTGQPRTNAMQDQQRLYQMHLQQQQQAIQARHARQAGQDQNGAPNAGINATENNLARAGAANHAKARFWHNFRTYAEKNNVSIEQNPIVAGKPIDNFELFVAANNGGVIKLPEGASATAAWSNAARILGFAPEEHPNVIEELKRIYDRNLKDFIATWKDNMAKIRQRDQIQAQAQVQAQARAQMQQHPQQSEPQQQHVQPPTDMTLSGPQMSPPGDNFRPSSTFQQSLVSNRSDQPQQPLRATQNAQLTQAKQQARSGVAAIATSGDSKHTMMQPSLDQSIQQQASRIQPTSPIKPDAPTIENVDQFSPDKPQSRKKNELKDVAMVDPEWSKPKDEYKAHAGVFSELDYGGISIATMAKVGETLRNRRPIIPSLEEMGVVDLHALALSIQSGIHGEVRNALDQLTAFTFDTRMTVLLDQCPELLDAFVDCAEDQVSILADGLEDATGSEELPSLASLLNEYRLENESVLPPPSFASNRHKLRIASDWLIAILTIVRNISFYDSLTNHQELVGSNLTHIICQAIRLLMTKRNAFQSARNAQDFMKDVTTIFSNIGHKVQLSSKDDAYAILHLLLAFAPKCSFDGPRLMFSTYDPRRHQYLPCAVDALAKLLACDDLNRIYFKNIFAADGSSSPPYRLLTQAFAMSVSPIPDRSKLFVGDAASDVRLAYHRAPFLSQGMLAADVLASLAPGAESGLAQSWLLSEDCWAPNLMHLVIKLGMTAPSDVRTLGQVTVDRGLSLLQRLLEKSLQQRNRPGQSRSDLASQLLLPCREKVVMVLMNAAFEKEPLKRIIDMAGMEL